MITKRTVLILGAGSSVHLGYPLGKDLVAEICACVFGRKYADEVRDKFMSERIEALGKRLSRSWYPSIDAFLEDNPDDAELGRMLIADCLKQHEDESRLFLPSDPGWYRNLFDALATPRIEDFATPSLTVITFNYDRSLEAFLHESIKYRYNLPDHDARSALKSVPIIHPHGILGEYPDVPYKTKLDGMPLSSLAEKITIVHELHDAEDQFCNDAFRRANEALQLAEEIIFLGFGFHDDNIRRLKFFSEAALREKQIRGTLCTEPTHRGRMLDGLKKYGLVNHHFYPNPIAIFFVHAFDFS